VGASPTLPQQLTSFVGRESDLADLVALLAAGAARADGPRLVTLTGPGGCGKTRLAVETARAVAGRFRDGVRLVDLAGLADPELVPQAVAAALGLREESNRPVVVSLRDAVRVRHLLLVLDNCEHLLAACAVLAADLLQTGPAIVVLATSRQVLGIAGEVVRQVPPLPVPPPPGPPAGGPAASLDAYPAVRLFVDRAVAAAPDFSLTAANAAAVAEVCRRLDGLPLALELAAARVRGLPVEDLAARLDQRLRLLTAGNPAAPPRQRTLRATLDWSFDLLLPEEQILFRRLAVFADGFSLEAAETVCSGPPAAPADLDRDAVLDGLISLVDKSLVQLRPSPGGGAWRYWLLDSMRQYARERLIAAGEADALGARHCAWCFHLAEGAATGLTGPRQTDWLDRIEREHQNLRAALDWSLRADPAAGLALAGRLWHFWEIRAHHTEGRQRLSALLAAAPAGPRHPPPARAAALLGAGVLASTQRDHAVARALLEESLSDATRGGDAAGAARAECALGGVVQEQGEFQRARELFESSLAYRRAAGDRAGTAEAVSGLAGLAAARGEYRSASALYAEASALFRDLGDTWRLARTLGHLARVHVAVEDYDGAAALYGESLASWRALGDRENQRWVVGQLGNVARIQGRFADARLLLEECLRLAEQSGGRNGLAAALHVLANLAAAEGDFALAAAHYEASLRLRREVGDTHTAGITLGDMGNLARAQGDLARARALWRESLAIARTRLGHRWLVSWALGNVATLLVRGGDHAAAVRLTAAATAFHPFFPQSIDPDERVAHEEALATARAALGEATFAALWAQGQTSSPDAALTEADAVLARPTA
jgi:predicted ATPase